MPRRFRTVVPALALALACQGCLTGTLQERRSRGTARLIAGGAMTALAVGLAVHYQGDRCREGPGFAPDSCFLPQVGALALGATGALLATAGVINLVGSVEIGPRERVHEPERPRARTASSDQAACAVWASAYDSESDPLRRQSLLASRPGHCADRAPGQGTSRP